MQVWIWFSIDFTEIKEWERLRLTLGIFGCVAQKYTIERVYQDWRKPEKALEYYQQAINSFKDLKDERSISILKDTLYNLF